MSATILVGHVIDRLRELPDESVHCVVTSPPYFGLRDYGTALWDGGDPSCDHSYFRGGNGAASAKQVTSNGTQKYSYPNECKDCGAVRVDKQIGLEPTLADYLGTMVEVFRDVRRVLRSDGLCFLNIGDSYASAWPAPNTRRNIVDNPMSGGKRGPQRQSKLSGALKEKDLMLVPHRLAIALQADGWWVRSDIIWSKPNPMPESVTDRPTSAHEHIFMLAKSARYYCDMDAVRELSVEPERVREDRVGGANGHTVRHSLGGIVKRVKVPGGWDRGEGAHGTIHRDGRSEPEYQEVPIVAGRNLRNVWNVATYAFPDAHFATFPTEIPRRCIKAGCPVGGTVLDPFLGSGTTLLVADQLGRNGIGIELNPSYAAMAEQRIRSDAPMFADVSVA